MKNRKTFFEKLEERAVLSTTAIGSFVGQTINQASDSLLSAKADFFIDDNNTNDLSDDKLIVHLINTGPIGANVPSDILTGVYFDINNTPSLKPISAIVPEGSYIFNRSDLSQPTNVGGEWDFRGDGGWTPNIDGKFNPEFAFSQRYGISAAGLSIFGHGSFNGPDLNPPSKDTTKPIRGMDYGIISKLGLNPNRGLIDEPLIVNEVVFTFDGFRAGDISNVSFQYGTAANEPRINVISNPDNPTVNLTSQNTNGYEGPTSNYIFTAAMSKPSIGTTIVHTTVGDIVITNGETVGTLVIASNNDEDVYLDATTSYCKILSISNSEGIEVLIGDPSDATSYILDTIDTTTVDLSASQVFESNNANYIFTATLSNPSQGITIVKTTMGDIVIGDNQTVGMLIIASDNLEDVYKDASELTVSIIGAEGGNFENLVVGKATATAFVLDTIDDTTLDLTASTMYEGDDAKYVFTATLSNPAQTQVVVKTSVGDIVINAGESVGVLSIDANNKEDVYKDASIMEASVDSIFGGNFENLIVGSASAVAQILDTINVTSVTLIGSAYYDAGGFYSLTVDLDNPSQGITVVALSDGSQIVIGDGESSGSILIESKDLNINISSVDGGNFEDTKASGSVSAPVSAMSISGVVFKDLDEDGVRDGIEPVMAGETITITYTSWISGVVSVTVATDAAGHYTFYAADAVIGTTYVVTPEPTTTGESMTVNAGGTSGSVSSGGTNVTADFAYHSADFAQNGLTIGFWSNKNGAKLMDANNDGLMDAVPFSMLKDLNLRNADGTRFITGNSLSIKTFQSWLNAANAKNMVNMLSAQLAGTVMNVYKSYVDTSLFVDLNNSLTRLTPSMIEQLNARNLGNKDCEFVKVKDVVDAAAMELGSHQNGENRTYQEALKNILDAINNNRQIFNG